VSGSVPLQGAETPDSAAGPIQLGLRANGGQFALLRAGNAEVKRVGQKAALAAATTHRFDYVTPYVRDLAALLGLVGAVAYPVKKPQEA